MSDQKPEIQKPSEPKSFSIGRVLMMVVPLALIAVLAGAAYVFDLGTVVTNWFKPPLVAATGVVRWNGKVLRGGDISTQHENKSLRGASGFIGADGTFKLETMVDGRIREGAYAGKHKVIIRQVDRNAPTGAFQPPPATPEKYLEFASTDLTIDVTRDGEKNNFQLEMSGTGPAGQTNADPPASTESPEPTPQQSPADVVKQLLERADSDMDGKLSAEEQRSLGPPWSFGIHNADSNQDGAIDEEELLKMVQQAPGG